LPALALSAVALVVPAVQPAGSLVPAREVHRPALAALFAVLIVVLGYAGTLAGFLTGRLLRGRD
jgi:hypothetical protein